MRFSFLVCLVAMTFSGCVTQSQPFVDTRVGTELSPYRSIPTYLECGDCRMPIK